MRHTYIALALAALAAPSLARPDGVGGHHGDHGAGHHVEHGASAGGSAPSSPAASYGAPSSGYEQPSSGYEQPSVGYEQPSVGYEQPSAGGYQEPSSGYGQPASGSSYDYGATGPGQDYSTGSETAAAGGFDLSTLLVPILIIAGLALLFPQVVTVPVAGTGRRKREAGDSSENLVERMQDIYMAVVESEECMERIACEVGGMAADAGLNKGMTKMAESYVPKKYQKMMKNFNASKDCHKIKCGAF